MPRARRDEADPTHLRNTVATQVDDDDLEMIRRVMKRYGMSKAGAARLLIRAGAQHHDPSPPSKETS